MSNYLDLSDNELDLIGGGLRIMMTENAKTSMEVTEKKPKQYYESLSLELLTLCSKVNLPDIKKYLEFSINELKLIKSALLLLAAFVYQKSLRETEKSKMKYYDTYNLQLIKVRDKINRIESEQKHLTN